MVNDKNLKNILTFIILIVIIFYGIFNKKAESDVVSIPGNYIDDNINISNVEIDYSQRKEPCLSFDISKMTTDNIEITLNMILFNNDEKVYSEEILLTLEDLAQDNIKYKLPNDFVKLDQGEIEFHLILVKVLDEDNNSTITG